ncbi:MAG: DUF1707 and DUF2154 domain-containing protein [Gammaproteobacteria bacterium]|nr:DUF1707 and DUF2154 domain-containing protein [Gammaproteobacteria bacterium]
MTVIIQDRPIETLREEIIDQLIMNYSHGEISLAAFERRLDVATNTDNHQTLVDLTQDLELTVDSAYTAKKEQGLSASIHEQAPQDHDYIVSIFGGNDRSGIWNVAKNLTSITIFGGNDIDFTDARFSRDTTIKIYSLFGGQNIYVPPNIKVIAKTVCIFGGVNNKSSACTSNSSAPTITIEGYVIFSGLDIKIKVSIKEQLMNFADEMKKFFS